MPEHLRMVAGGSLLAIIFAGMLAAPDRLVAQVFEPPVYCFAPGTPQNVIDAYNLRAKAVPSFYTNGRWSGTNGSPRALTWSFFPDGVIVGQESKASELFAIMDAKFAAQGGRQKWISLFEECFARWSSLTGTTYTRVKQGASDWDDGAAWGTGGGAARGDIRIGSILVDGASNVLAYNYYPSNGDMILDSAENWASSGNSFRFMRNILMHEHGHGLGLRHVCPTNGTKLMEPYLNTSFDGPQHDDVRAGQYLYGDPSEDNNSTASAKHIGSFGPGSSLDFGTVPAPAISNGSVLSIDANGEEDYYRFTATGSTGLSLTLTPLGLTYDSSIQDANGNCTSGTLINSLTLADLSVQVVDANAIVLATGAAASAGQPETLTEVFLPAAGDYYIRVYESNTPTGPQLYRLSLSFAAMDCNSNGTPDPTDLINGTSLDCNGNSQPDECEIALDGDGDSVPDSCEWAHGDLDLDGDVDQSDFGIFQRCLGFPAAGDLGCDKALLDGDGDVDSGDLAIFQGCLSGADTPYDPGCR